MTKKHLSYRWTKHIRLNKGLPGEKQLWANKDCFILFKSIRDIEMQYQSRKYDFLQTTGLTSLCWSTS